MDELKISPKMSVKDAIKRLDETGKKILVVIDNTKLRGVITDGDIRRWILKNGSLEVTVDRIMNKNPQVLYHSDYELAKKMMRTKSIQAVPIVNNEGKFMDIIFWEDTFKQCYISKDRISIPVVIMAGGKGTRLYPYTKVLPKPLIPIGEQTILERIIEQFTQVGCEEFYLTVNYKKNMIKTYMEEVSKEYQITYVEEEKFLGTAGSLNMLRGVIQETFIVSNCDILVEADYGQIYKYHKEKQHKITMVTTLKNYVIPYGVIKNNEEGCIETIQEKPEYHFQVNTGLYILEPEVLEDIPNNTFFHITELINQYINEGKKVGVYPLMEKSWMDMGELKEMQNMLQQLDIEL